MLQGHDRAITQIKYNREGDLLFSCAKDSKPNVWWSLNGERLGTYNGHQGVVVMAGARQMRQWPIQSPDYHAVNDEESLAAERRGTKLGPP